MKLSIREQQIMSEAASFEAKTRREQLLAESAEFRKMTSEELAIGGPNETPSDDEGQE